jgi:hypothetical protein
MMPNFEEFLERFPPKLFDFGDKEALKDSSNRAFLPRLDRIVPIWSKRERPECGRPYGGNGVQWQESGL